MLYNQSSSIALKKHLVSGQCQNAPNVSAFPWSPPGILVSIGQHFVITRVVHLLKRTETSLITKADLITESDQAVWAVHSCNSWFSMEFCPKVVIFDIYIFSFCSVILKVSQTFFFEKMDPVIKHYQTFCRE